MYSDWAGSLQSSVCPHFRLANPATFVANVPQGAQRRRGWEWPHRTGLPTARHTYYAANARLLRPHRRADTPAASSFKGPTKQLNIAYPTCPACVFHYYATAANISTRNAVCSLTGRRNNHPHFSSIHNSDSQRATPARHGHCIRSRLWADPPSQALLRQENPFLQRRV